jgi:hypothetical protein
MVVMLILIELASIHHLLASEIELCNALLPEIDPVSVIQVLQFLQDLPLVCSFYGSMLCSSLD